MPTKGLERQTGHQRFDWPLTGKLRKDVDPALIGETNFRELINLRPTADYPKGIQGMTKINVASLRYLWGFIVRVLSVVNGFHFRKDQPAESHIFVQGNYFTVPWLLKSDNTTAIPNQDTFCATTSAQLLENTNAVLFSEAPNGAMCAMNGAVNRIWAGNEDRCGQFIVYDPAGSFWYDYTDKVNNTLSDAANVATMHSAAGTVDSSTKLLIHAGEANHTAGTSIIDSETSAKTITAHGNAQVDTSQAKFGTGSVAFDGTNSYLSLADSADWYMGTGAFTIDFWWKPNGSTNPQGLFQQTVDTNNWVVCIYVPISSVLGQLSISVKSGGSLTVNVSYVAGIIDGAWNHIALIRGWGGDANKWAWAINGTLAYAADTNVNPWPDLAAAFEIGRYYNYGTTTYSYLKGWIDEFRISKGVARWTANFLPSSSAYGTADTTNVYIGSVRPIQGVKFYVGTANTNASVASGYEWTGAAWSPLTLYDGTSATGGKSLGKTGEIIFNSTVTTSKVKAVKRSVAYFYQFVFTTLTTGTTVYYCTLDAPMQAVTDIWDGVGRYCLQCFQSDGTSYTDLTTNVAPSTTSNPKAYQAASDMTYAQLGGQTVSQCLYCGFSERVLGIEWSLPDALYTNNSLPSTMDFIDGTVDPTAQLIFTSTGSAYAMVASVTITSGSWAGGDAAGKFLITGWNGQPFDIGAGTHVYYQSFVTVAEATSQPVSPVSPATVSIYYWNGSAWVSVGNVDDSTATGGISLSHSGLMTWAPPAENIEFKTAIANDYEFYYYKVSWDTTLASDVRVDNIGGITVQKTLRPYRFSVLWQNRLWMFNDQADRKNTGICSSYGTNCVFNGDDFYEMEFGDAKELICGDSLFSRYGSNIYDNMILCKRGATYLIDGYGPSTWTIYTISDKVGCLAPLTMKRCDMSFEVAAGMTKHVLMWRSARAIEFFDGNTIAPVTDDIKNFFDPTSSDYIDPTIYDVSLESGCYDEINFGYHWIFTNINGKQEWEYSLRYKKWFQVNRGTGKALTCGFNVQDTNGDTFLFGGTADGFIERLENGTTFDGNALVHTFWFGDILLAKTGDYVCTLRHVKLFAKAKNISSATVAVTHYADTASTGESLAAISQVDATHRLYQAKHSIGMDAVLHSLRYDITTNDEVIGFEPLMVSGLYEVKREDL
jgi:hypothetical protein